MGEVVNVLVAVAVVVLVVRWASSGASDRYSSRGGWSDERYSRCIILGNPRLFPLGHAWKCHRLQGWEWRGVALSGPGIPTKECYSGNGTTIPFDTVLP